MHLRADRTSFRFDVLDLEDEDLAAPVAMTGPGEHGGYIFEGVSGLLVDLPYPDGVERVEASALEDCSAWEGRPFVLQGPEHEADAIDADPTIQGREQRGVVLSARYLPAKGKRIIRFAVPDPADVELVRTKYRALSEAYHAITRDPTDAERAQGITAVQIGRRPLSLAGVDRGRAGPRAIVRTDGDTMIRTDAADPAAGGDALAAFSVQLREMFKAPEARVFARAILDELDGGKASPAAPDMDAADPAVPVKPEEVAAMRADAAAQKARADKAEADLVTYRTAELRSKASRIDSVLSRDGIKVDGWDLSKPTAEMVATAESAIVAHALRTDSADPFAAPTQRPNARADGATNTPNLTYAQGSF